MPSMIKSTAFGLLATAASVAAHGFVDGIVADGTFYTGYLVNEYPYQASPPASIGWTEAATDLGFVAPSAYTSGDIICHKSATNAKATATVAAGGTVVMEWNTWPESHHGPIIDYMANCNGDCTTVDKTTLEFFKIAEVGLVSDGTVSPGTWASDSMMANNNSWSITVPSTIAAGNYVLRHEIIALHSANNADGAQNYPQCINLVVTGGGSDTPAGTLGEALYTETDPGILFNLYTTPLSYTIPGPALYSAGSGSGTVASSAAPVATAAPSATSASPTTMVTSVRPAATTAAASAVPTAAAEEEDDTCE